MPRYRTAYPPEFRRFAYACFQLEKSDDRQLAARGSLLARDY